MADLAELCPLRILGRLRRIWRRCGVFLGLPLSWNVSHTISSSRMQLISSKTSLYHVHNWISMEARGRVKTTAHFPR